jgi:hypothetical protein
MDHILNMPGLFAGQFSFPETILFLKKKCYYFLFVGYLYGCRLALYQKITSGSRTGEGKRNRDIFFYIY